MAHTLDTDVYQTRTAEADADAQFIERWSPRAMSGEPVTIEELNVLFEAARWAPSCFNSQPWRFVFAHRDSAEWEPLLGLLVDANRTWAVQAGVLLAVCSQTTFERNGKPAPTHAFDTGSAWMSLALQARSLGLVAHAMWGFDHDAAPAVLNLPDNHSVQAMVAVGRPGRREDLPEPYDEREAPSPRKSLEEIVVHGRFP